MRSFQGRASEELYNQDLTKLYDTLKNIHSVKPPENAIEGALWIDENNNLKVKREDKFVLLFENVFQAMEKIIQRNQPLNPKPGQLWITDGVLVYYNGIKWESVKAANIEDFSMDGFEPFLIIDALEAAGNEIIKKQHHIIEEEFIVKGSRNEFNLQKGRCHLKPNKVVVYVNGRFLARTKFFVYDKSTIRLKEPAKDGEHILIQYVSEDVSIALYNLPTKFLDNLDSINIAISEKTDTILLPSQAHSKKDMMIYVNGRYLPQRDFYIEEDAVTVVLKTELRSGEEIIVEYLPMSLYGATTEDEPIQDIPYSQYLWPSSEYDRLFMDGKLHSDYETVNNITIQYPSLEVQGKMLSAVHVHPKNLCDIQKTVYLIDKNSKFVQVDELNTEFYALREGKTIEVEGIVESNLMLNEDNSALVQNDNTRSFITVVYPGTEYKIKRNAVTPLFKVSEYANKPSVGEEPENVINVEDIQNEDTVCSLITDIDTHYLLIQLSSQGGEFNAPEIMTTVKKPESILMIKTDASDSDYVSDVGGIRISEYIARTYDCILAVKYIFGETTGRGSLKKVSFPLTDDSQINIGKIGDPLLVFAQGHYLIERDNYKYDKSTGVLTLLFPEKIDVGVITFPRFEGGYILEKTDDGKGIITIHKQMTKPLVFVYGEQVQKLADFEQYGNLIHVHEAQIDMSYAVVDCADAYGNSMYIGDGRLQYDIDQELCYLQTDINFNYIPYILFVNGLLINANDSYYDEKTKRLYVLNKAEPDMRYTLLKDEQHRFIHSNIKQANVYSTETGADQALLYVDGNIVGDIESFGVLHLPESGYQREIKGIVSYSNKDGYVVQGWYMYIGSEWVKLTDTSQTDLLNRLLNHYILENKTVHFTNITPYRGKHCKAWLYKYDNTIEYPLMYYGYDTTDSLSYKVLPAHGYPINKNALSVYIDGYRQYPQKMNFMQGIKEIDEHTFEIFEKIPGCRLDYVVEMPENGETASCISEILTSDDIKNQTLKTTVPLLPGFVDLFIDGIRQPKTSFEIIDRHTIILNGFLKDPRYHNTILLELRKDYALKEAVRVIEKDGQTTFNCVDDMRSILSTKDFIKIYVNGIFVADDYLLVREQGIINIPKLNRLGFDKKGHVVSFIWR